MFKLPFPEKKVKGAAMMLREDETKLVFDEKESALGGCGEPLSWGT